jgi:uncharacterized protein
MGQIPPNISIAAKGLFKRAPDPGQIAAKYLEATVTELALDGWDFQRVDAIGVKTSPGCIAGLFGARKQTTSTTSSPFVESEAVCGRKRAHLVVYSVALVRIYQRTASPELRSSCRFSPSCSNLAIRALLRWGFRRGFMLTAIRLWRCRPPFGGRSLSRMAVFVSFLGPRHLHRLERCEHDGAQVKARSPFLCSRNKVMSDAQRVKWI